MHTTSRICPPDVQPKDLSSSNDGTGHSVCRNHPLAELATVASHSGTTLAVLAGRSGRSLYNSSLTRIYIMPACWRMEDRGNEPGGSYARSRVWSAHRPAAEGAHPGVRRLVIT